MRQIKRRSVASSLAFFIFLGIFYANLSNIQWSLKHVVLRSALLESNASFDEWSPCKSESKVQILNKPNSQPEADSEEEPSGQTPPKEVVIISKDDNSTRTDVKIEETERRKGGEEKNATSINTETSTRMNSGFGSQNPASIFSTLNFFERYLYYPRKGDFCSGINHYTWSLNCGFAEAVYLNRSYLLDMELCVDENHNNGVRTIQDVRLYFDIEHVMKKTGLRVTPFQSFLIDQTKWNELIPDAPIIPKAVPIDYPTIQLQNETALIIQRNLLTLSDYGFDVCKPEYNEKVLNREFIPAAPHLLDIAWKICETMDWYYDSVHVRRGDKLDNRRWPHLDNDTRPESLLEKLPKLIPPGNHLYIATDETTPNFFSPLNKWYKIHILDDYAHFWAKHSEWYNKSKLISGEFGQKEPVFDGNMRGQVDYAVRNRANIRVETFNDLTSDDKHGIAA